MNTTDMNAIETLAVCKAIKEAAEKTASANLAPGTHTVDCTVRVTGIITKGEDYNQNIVAKADPWTLLAVAMSKLNGVTLESIVKDALNTPEELIEAIKLSAKTAVEAVKAPTLTACKGKVTTKLTVAKIG